MIAKEQFESEIVMQAFMPLSIDKIGSQYVNLIQNTQWRWQNG